MGQATGIEWTDATFNPWWGCTNVSPECDHCYAESGANRYGFKIWGQDAPRRFFGDKHWAEPRKWNAKAKEAGSRIRVFCGSYCDVMEDRRDLDPYRDRLYDLIYETPHLDWQLLTKRPQNFRRFLPPSMIASPLPNMWLMTTVGVRKSLWRIDSLKSCPAVVLGLSCEPLLEELPTLGEYLDGISWVICGGESGPGARSAPAEWFRNVRDQCQNSGVAFFFKQMGGVRDKRGSLGSIPEDLRIREFPVVGQI